MVAVRKQFDSRCIAAEEITGFLGKQEGFWVVMKDWEHPRVRQELQQLL